MLLLVRQLHEELSGLLDRIGLAGGGRPNQPDILVWEKHTMANLDPDSLFEGGRDDTDSSPAPIVCRRLQVTCEPYELFDPGVAFPQSAPVLHWADIF